ncbi:MAG: hypothetical protein ACYCOO_09860 [Chitinophagaceae bacterium]
MKSILFFAFAIFGFNTINAQSNIPLPEFKNTINRINIQRKTLSNLEKADGQIGIRMKVLG